MTWRLLFGLALAALLAAGCANATLLNPPTGRLDGGGLFDDANLLGEGGSLPEGSTVGRESGGAGREGGGCNGGSACTGGSQCCSTGCADLLTDSNNCGSCGHACTGGATCSAGVCSGCGSATCGTGQVCCSGSCVDPTSDSANCGSCGHACTSPTTCMGGSCLCGAGGKSCPSSGKMIACCGVDCVDLCTTTGHCGSCNTNCGMLNSCVYGACLFATPDGGGATPVPGCL